MHALHLRSLAVFEETLQGVFQVHVELDRGPETGEGQLQKVVQVVSDFFSEERGEGGVEVRKLEGGVLGVVHCVFFKEVLVLVDYVLFCEFFYFRLLLEFLAHK